MSRDRRRRIDSALDSLTAVVAVMPWLGTLPAMILACGVLPILWGERRWWLVAIYALALPVAVTLLFVGGLEVRVGSHGLGSVQREIAGEDRQALQKDALTLAEQRGDVAGAIHGTQVPSAQHHVG